MHLSFCLTVTAVIVNIHTDICISIHKYTHAKSSLLRTANKNLYGHISG